MLVRTFQLFTKWRYQNISKELFYFHVIYKLNALNFQLSVRNCFPDTFFSPLVDHKWVLLRPWNNTWHRHTSTFQIWWFVCLVGGRSSPRYIKIYILRWFFKIVLVGQTGILKRVCVCEATRINLHTPQRKFWITARNAYFISTRNLDASTVAVTVYCVSACVVAACFHSAGDSRQYSPWPFQYNCTNQSILAGGYFAAPSWHSINTRGR